MAQLYFWVLRFLTRRNVLKLMSWIAHPNAVWPFLTKMKLVIFLCWGWHLDKFLSKLVWDDASILIYLLVKRMAYGKPTFLLFFLCRLLARKYPVATTLLRVLTLVLRLLNRRNHYKLRLFLLWLVIEIIFCRILVFLNRSRGLRDRNSALLAGGPIFQRLFNLEVMKLLVFSTKLQGSLEGIWMLRHRLGLNVLSSPGQAGDKGAGDPILLTDVKIFWISGKLTLIQSPCPNVYL